MLVIVGLISHRGVRDMGKILIVEDDSIIRKGLKRMIFDIDNGQEVFTTGYATQAKSIARAEKIDLFLLDIVLLDYSGIDFAREIREIEAYKLTPIVFITSIPTRELIAFKETHCYDYIIKPFKLEKIKNTLETIINHGINNNQEQQRLILKQKEYTLSLNFKDIIYLEYRNRKLHISTLKETLEISTYTLSKVQEQLPTSFIRCHKGYIVNEDFIIELDRTNRMIRLIDDLGEIPYGEAYKDALRGEWL